MLASVGSWHERWFEEDGDLMTTISQGRTMLSFDHEEDFRLASIEAFPQPRIALWGQLAYPNDLGTVLDLLRNQEIVNEKFELEEWELGDTCQVPSLSMTFFFDEDQSLDGIAWSVLFTDEDEIIWPWPSEVLGP